LAREPWALTASTRSGHNHTEDVVTSQTRDEYNFGDVKGDVARQITGSNQLRTSDPYG
jgi:hypothetical protein